MPAPTALQRAPEQLPEQSLDEQTLPDAPAVEQPLALVDAVVEDSANATASTIPQPSDPASPADGPVVDDEGRPHFAPQADLPVSLRVESRKVPIPPHRWSPLKTNWSKIYPPLVEHLKLQCRVNVKSRAVELRTSKHTSDRGALQKGEDFVRAFAMGFDLDDAIALLRLDDLYIESFEIKDVKTLTGDHLSRAVGRIAGKDGKVKFAIENATKTRIVLADSKIHILGGFKNIHAARESVVSLILGAQPGKVYSNLRIISSRMKERF